MKTSTSLKYDLIFERVMDIIPESIKKGIKLKAIRDNMPKSSFLIESDRKFPVKNPGDINYNPKLVYAAYLKASRGIDAHPEYQEVLESAIRIFKEINGPKKINFRLDECFAKNDRDILNAIYLLEGKFDKIKTEKNEFDEELPVSKDDMTDEINGCICPNCSYEDTLDIEDEGLCEEKTCPKCNQKMIHSGIVENIQIKLHEATDIKDKFKIVLEHTLNVEDENIDPNYCICKKCDIIIKKLISEQNNGFCPECGDKTSLVNKNYKLFTESHAYCPNCLTITEYSIMEQDCPVCRSIMVSQKKIVNNPTVSSIPIDD
jgi:Zn ribbon nucleic-acid-binding protein